MKTFYICEHQDSSGNMYWKAHRQGILSAFGKFNNINSVCSTITSRSMEDCETMLYRVVYPMKPKVVKVVKL